jgi:predicted nucleic acid-binding protein
VTLLWDTGAAVALVNKRDQWHTAAKKRLRLLQRRRARLLLTNFLVGEIYALLLSRLGGDVARRWLGTNDVAVERVTEADEFRARTILLRYTDKDFSYVDATSFAVMERLGLQTAFTFDEHFVQYGFTAWGG